MYEKLNVVIECENCKQKLRVPYMPESDLNVTCPKCGAIKNLGKDESTNIAIEGRVETILHDIKSHLPKVAIFGKTGAGKSSLCNALFGAKISPVSDVDACTRELTEVKITDSTGKGILLIDAPGVGESRERDEEYKQLYKKTIPNIDLIFWLIKADDRALEKDQEFYTGLVLPLANANNVPIIFVLSQIEKLGTGKGWNEESNQPSSVLKELINEKIGKVANFFNISDMAVIAISSENKYGLQKLVDVAINILPSKKKYSFAREAEEEFVSESAKKEIKKGILDSIVEGIQFFGEKAVAVAKYIVENKDIIVEAISVVAPKIIPPLKKIFEGLKKFKF